MNYQTMKIIYKIFIFFLDFIKTLEKYLKTLSDSARAYISEPKEARNKWAHSEPISSDDVDDT